MLRKLFNRAKLSGKATQPTLRLPIEIEDLLRRRESKPLVEWLQSLRDEPAGSEKLSLLLQRAATHGWPSEDHKKLTIFGQYYSGEIRAAAEGATQYIDEHSFDADLFIIAAFSLYHLGDFEGAYARLRSARAYEPQLSDRADYHICAALICQSANRPRELKHHIDEARRLSPTDPVVALNAYAMNFELGDMAAFKVLQAEFDRGLHPLEQSGFALAVVALAQGDYLRGFELLEYRYTMAEAHRYLNRALFDLPRWRGEPLEGKTLLVSAEQGLGDTVQLVRYLPALERLGARQIIVESQPETLSLLASNFPSFRFCERRHNHLPPHSFDLWTATMSLPHLLGTTVDSVPSRGGYLKVPEEHGAYWSERVENLAPTRRTRIGLAWSGQPTHRADRRRSIPAQYVFEQIRDIDADFFALQMHVPNIRPRNLIDVSEEMLTLADTAALTEQMDLVITVDTSIVHIGGAIGKEVWLLLPHRYEWRWGLQGEENPWYESVRVLRQGPTQGWVPVLDEAFSVRLPNRIRQLRR